MRPSHHLVIGLAIGCTASAACRPAVSSGSSELGSVPPVRLAGPVPTTFHADLRGAGGDSDGGGTLQARVWLEIVEGRFEYRLRLRNPGGAVVTEALVYDRGEEGRPAAPVMVLFSNGQFRAPMLELRGTAAVLASMRAERIAEELQSSPGTFGVVLRGSGPDGDWVVEGRVN